MAKVATKAAIKKTAAKKPEKKAEPKAEKKAEKKAAERVKITLLVSPIGFNRNQAAVVQGMGLRRIRHSVELADTPETRGMIHKVRHLVKVGN
jgi:large subunit ribosomal protein L30